jgi:hypothetical protein
MHGERIKKTIIDPSHSHVSNFIFILHNLCIQLVSSVNPLTCEPAPLQQVKLPSLYLYVAGVHYNPYTRSQCSDAVGKQRNTLILVYLPVT